MTRQAQPSRRPAGNDPRTRKIRAIMAACNRLGLDEDARRDRIEQVSGQRSLSRLTDGQLGKLLDALNGGWKPGRADRPHLGKIKALWWSLYWLGEIDEPGDSALNAFVKRQTGLSALRFVDFRYAPSVIEALKSWLERAGVEWPTAEQTASLQVRRPTFTATQHERTAVVHAQKALIARRGHSFPGHYVTEFMVGLERLQTGTFSILDLEVPELDGLIRHLGLVIRKGKA